MAAYENVLPGSANRIVQMAENSAVVRDDALRDTTKAEIEYGSTGQNMAFTLALVAILAAIGFFIFGDELAGGCLLSVPVLMFIKSFLPSRE